jgi:hypothetical protein
VVEQLSVAAALVATMRPDLTVTADRPVVPVVQVSFALNPCTTPVLAVEVSPGFMVCVPDMVQRTVPQAVNGVTTAEADGPVRRPAHPSTTTMDTASHRRNEGRRMLSPLLPCNGRGGRELVAPDAAVRLPRPLPGR